jgi:hypothetical protein
VAVPPLRERIPDIPEIAEYLLPQIASEHPDAPQQLMSYSFPGDVRELRNLLDSDEHPGLFYRRLFRMRRTRNPVFPYLMERRCRKNIPYAVRLHPGGEGSLRLHVVQNFGRGF